MKRTVFQSLIATLLIVSSGAATATTYQCDVTPTKNGKQNAAISPDFKVEFDRGDVIISDDFIRATGKRALEGNYDRMVKDDILFSWSVSGVPRNLMPQEVTWYRPQVNYRGRLNTKTMQLKVSGDFVPRYGGGYTGTDLRGLGVCEKVAG
ncbi:MAG: hypothetical protein AAF672_07990 [Pseudomonadota bacterium]